MKALAAALLLFAVPAAATPARPLDFDMRVETLEWREGAVLSLRTTVGGSLTVIFAPGEAVQAVIVGDPSALEIQIPPQADSLVLRTLRRPFSDTITVRTQLRQYRFKVITGPANDVAYVVRLSIPAPEGNAAPSPVLPPPDAVNAYTLKGENSLRPVRVLDDGSRTYIEWGPDQALPAVFALSPLGEEETVDAHMRGGVMVIDRVYTRLIFRIGKFKAQAARLPAAKQVKP
jgi:type IV secretion system protein VirB9